VDERLVRLDCYRRGASLRNHVQCREDAELAEHAIERSHAEGVAFAELKAECEQQYAHNDKLAEQIDDLRRWLRNTADALDDLDADAETRSDLRPIIERLHGYADASLS
jgi:phage shock protein A